MSNRITITLASAFTLLLLALTPPLLLAYEGFGAVTRGAQDCPGGYSTYHVTSLSDSGAGSLRDALTTGCREIVFDIGGTITLSNNLHIAHSYITINGQSAPAPGITIVQPGSLGSYITTSGSTPTHDIIIHHLRVDGQANGAHLNAGDILSMDGSDAPVYNIILDHITANESTDGIFDLYGRVYNLTVSWSVIQNTRTAVNFMQDRTEARDNISFHHNLFSHNNERQVKVRFDSKLDFVNNVIYGWGWYECAGRGLHIQYDDTNDPVVNVVSNYFHYVEGTVCADHDGAVIYNDPSGSGVNDSKIYMQDNILPANERDTEGTTTTPMTIPAEAQVSVFEADTLGDNVVNCVGTHYRTSEEQAQFDLISIEIGGSGGSCSASSPSLAPPSPPTNLTAD